MSARRRIACAFILGSFILAGCEGSKESPPELAVNDKSGVEPRRLDPVSVLPSRPADSAEAAPQGPAASGQVEQTTRTPAASAGPRAARLSAPAATPTPTPVATTPAAPAPKALPAAHRPEERPIGAIARANVSRLQLFDARGNLLRTVDASAVAIPSSGLPVYEEKGLLLRVRIDGQDAWVKETQVALVDRRQFAVPPPRPGGSPDKARKGVSPGLDR